MNLKDEYSLSYGDGKVIKIEEVKKILAQHRRIIESLMYEHRKATADRAIIDAHCPSCNKLVTRGVQRWQKADVGRYVWFEDFPDDPSHPYADPGDVLYFDYDDGAHFYTHNECGDRLPEWIGDLLDGLTENWYLPEQMPYDEEDQ